jgi:hypothetical protein
MQDFIPTTSAKASHLYMEEAEHYDEFLMKKKSETTKSSDRKDSYKMPKYKTVLDQTWGPVRKFLWLAKRGYESELRMEHQLENVKNCERNYKAKKKKKLDVNFFHKVTCAPLHVGHSVASERDAVITVRVNAVGHLTKT